MYVVSRSSLFTSSPLLKLLSFSSFSTSKATRTFYQTLGLTKSATTQQIKAQYFLLAKKYHPDTHQQNPQLVGMFRQINEAYNVLRDPAKVIDIPTFFQRREYDNQTFTATGDARKQYRFYDTQHTYGYGKNNFYRQNQRSKSDNYNYYHENPYKQQKGFTNSYSSTSSSTNQTNQQHSNSNYSYSQYLQQQHRKNVRESQLKAKQKQKQSQNVLMVLLTGTGILLIMELIFKTAQFKDIIKRKSYDETLDPRELWYVQNDMKRGQRRDYLL